QLTIVNGHSGLVTGGFDAQYASRRLRGFQGLYCLYRASARTCE
ncbi:MAG: hypothetical protein ACI8W7_003624, partial [Gammaproteobacteria bacterium]